MNASLAALTFLTAFESEPSAAMRKYMFEERMREQGLSFPLTEVQGYIIDSCLARFDERTAEVLLNDWKAAKATRRPSEYVHKFQPGTHYYALDEKFDTEMAAREHLKRKGYDCLGLNVKYVYTRQGD